jgi:TonB family protein
VAVLGSARPRFGRIGWRTRGEVVSVSTVSRITASFLAGTLTLLAPPPMAQDKVGEPDSERKVLNRVVPTYPELARKAGIRGKVRLLVLVAPNGKVKSAQIIGGNPVLGKAAEDAIGKWRFAVAGDETKEVIELRFNQE